MHYREPRSSWCERDFRKKMCCTCTTDQIRTGTVCVSYLENLFFFIRVLLTYLGNTNLDEGKHILFVFFENELAFNKISNFHEYFKTHFYSKCITYGHTHTHTRRF